MVQPLSPLRVVSGTTGPTWKIRRRIVIATLLWCALLITYISTWGRLHSVSETAINGAFLLMASVIGSYVFGAVWDDDSKRKTDVQASAVEAGIPPAPTGGGATQVNVSGPTVTTTDPPLAG